MRGKIFTQSFSLWALVTVFNYLKDANCVLEDIFNQLVSSMTTAINSQAKASFSTVAFLQQKKQKTLVSHLPSTTHTSVKYAHLSTPSSSSLFTEDIICGSLTRVKEDSQLSLLKNLSSLKGKKRSASPPSTSGSPSEFLVVFLVVILKEFFSELLRLQLAFFHVTCP